MAVGARDRIDRELVRKYAKLKVDNPDTTKLVDSQKMLSAMNDYAAMQRSMMDMKLKLGTLCSGVTSKAAVYTKITFIPPKLKQKGT